jgi:hypothetical protein
MTALGFTALAAGQLPLPSPFGVNAVNYPTTLKQAPYLIFKVQLRWTTESIM